MGILEIAMGIGLLMLAVTVLHFIWPILVLGALALFALSVYSRYRLRKEMKRQEQEYQNTNNQFYHYQNQKRREVEEPVRHGEIIETEYTEREVE